MYVVGFAGPARVGKTAVTTELALTARESGWDVKIMPFAGPLKNSAAEQGFGKTEDPEGYRKYCQEHGAEMRATDENYWLNQWRADVKEARDNHWKADSKRPLLIIADDVRYENELEAISSANGSLVFIHPGERLLPEADAEWRTHESEMLANTMIGNPDMVSTHFDYQLMNDKESFQLAKWAKAFFGQVINFPGSDDQICQCEGCRAMLENREADVDKLLLDLEDLMDDIDDAVGGDDDDE